MVLSLQRVGKTYVGKGKAVVALEDISLEIDRGEFVGIFGPTRAGKTTLLRIASGLEQPDSGTVICDGRPVCEMSQAERKRSRRREVGCVWRSPRFVSGLGVLETVALRLLIDGHKPREADRRAYAALEACGVEHCLESDPCELSDGDRQRVAIAQALVTNPKLLLADCPASDLDPEEQDSILAVFRTLAQENRVAILITDTSANAVRGARPVLYLRAGQLVNQDSALARAPVIDLASARMATPSHARSR